MDKVVDIQTAIADIRSGDTIMIGGFMANGAPERLVDALIKNDVRDITLISTDTAIVERGCGKLIADKRVKKLYASHIGTNKETGRQMNDGELEVELVPQGTLAERIRSAGFGLGGILTKTGVGTLVEDGKEKVIVDGEEYLLELPLKADFALIYAAKADRNGNLVYKGSTINFNHVMAAAANTTIVEVDELVETGELDPNIIGTPGVFVDRVVEGGK
jgi:acetate CoA/acetoacetate CoA-transferase alpha subunit